MQQNVVIRQNGLLQSNSAWLTHFFAKFALDIMPAALASVVGGFLFTQYQSGHSVAPRPVAEEGAPASAEMVRLVRDEHAMIVDYLKTQMAEQQSRHAAEDQATARAVADAKSAVETKLVAAAAAQHRLAAVTVASKAAAARSRAQVVAAAAPVVIPAHAPLVIAEAQPTDGAVIQAPAQKPNSLLAKTLDIKDHVVDGALHVVSAIGSIPSWIASMGDRIGGSSPGADSGSRQYSAAS